MAAIKGNWHTHSHYSDGKAPLRDYISEAAKLGLEYLGFSEHSPLPFPNTFALKPGKIDEYIQEARKFNSHDIISGYDGKDVKLPYVFAGLETDYIPGFSEDFSRLKDQHNLDYIIGSVHLVINGEADGLWFIDGPSRQIYDDGISYYFRGDIHKAVTAYYRQLQQMIQTEDFEIVGHLDKIKMHNQGRFFSENEKWYRTLVSETLAEIAARDLVVEVNTRGRYKRRCDALFPGFQVLKEMRSLNIPVIISSDAHVPDELTALFEEAAQDLVAAGYTTIRQLSTTGWEETSLTAG